MATAASATLDGRPLQPLTGLDGAFLALEADHNHLQVAALVVLDPSGADGWPETPDARYGLIRGIIERRLSLLPKLRQRVVRVPFGLQRPVWVDDPAFDLDGHLRRVCVRPTGGRRELEEVVADLMSRPLPLDRPLWEMVVVEGLAAGRAAVVARLHHAMVDGVAGATAMAAFLDVSPEPTTDGDAPATEGPSALDVPPLPSTLSMLAYATRSVGRQATEALVAVRRGIDTAASLAAQNRRLATEGTSPPPALFSAPQTSLNRQVSSERRFATVAVPLRDLELVRHAVGGGSGRREAAITANDVILSAVGGALSQLLERRGERVEETLVALVPVSVRGRRPVPAHGEAQGLGNDVSGMLVALGTTMHDPLTRLHAVAQGTRLAKEQEGLAGGDLLEEVTRALPPFVLRTAMRSASLLQVFDRVPPFNVVVSTVMVPDVSLWWAGCPVEHVYPVAPIFDGVGLNVTAMTYRGTVHFGLLGCRRLLPELDEFAGLLADAVAELVVAALDAGTGRRGSGANGRGTRQTA